MSSRRNFLFNSLKAGVGLPLWLRLNSASAFAQASSNYKAIVCIALQGGNDGNNMLLPALGAQYQQYASLRGTLALKQSAILPLNSNYSYPLAVHPAMPQIASLFGRGLASFVANVGPMKQPITKTQIQENSSLLPAELLSHTAGLSQWESATTITQPPTGWGGRIADTLSGQSGSLPMVLDAGSSSIFTVGNVVQGITVQGGTASVAPIPLALGNAALQLSMQNVSSKNLLVAQAAQLLSLSWTQQAIIAKAQSAGSTFSTAFPNSGIGEELAQVAKLINGRSVIGASRQIFYVTQGGHDTHVNQLNLQSSNLGSLDAAIGAFVSALQEIGMLNDVLICTHSDFGRSMAANVDGGTDHAWGNTQIILGGGVGGGKVIGSLPELELGGSHDLNGIGTWIPTISSTQMAAAAGSWIGLNSAQLATVFPDLANFPSGPITLS